MRSGGHTPRPVVVAAALMAFVAATPVARANAAGLAVSRPTIVRGGFLDLRVDPGGSVRVATALQHGADIADRAWVTRVTPGRPAGRAASILPPTMPLRADVPSVLTPAGAVTAYRAPGAGRTVIDVVTARAGHAPSRPRIASARGQLASDPSLYAGGGTIAVLYTARRPGGGKPTETIAVRPRGRGAFLKPVTVDPPTYRFDYRYVVEIGPGGAGAIVATPVFVDAPIRLRRISRGGRIGPWLTIAAGPYEDSFARLAVGKDGTIAVALIATPSGQDTSSGDREACLVTTTLPPHASAATPVQTLEPVGDGITAEENYGISIGSDGQVVATTSVDGPGGFVGPGHVDVFSGRGTALIKRASFGANEPSGMIGVARPDGGATVVWQTRKGEETTLVMGAQAGPDGRFSKPQVLARTAFRATKTDVQGEVSPRALLPLGGSRTVLAYDDETNDHGRLSVVRLSAAAAR